MVPYLNILRKLYALYVTLIMGHYETLLRKQMEIKIVKPKGFFQLTSAKFFVVMEITYAIIIPIFNL